MDKINPDIYWVGYIDWNLRNFHGYTTPSGSTYNAYLIMDEKPTLIDAVKYYGFEEQLRRIKRIIDPAKIQYIISNHTEMDHSGTIDKLLEFCPSAQVVCSPKGEEGLTRHFKKNWHFKVVQDGDTLNIGKRTLSFHLMPMVHWPDSMATYSKEDKILFPNDAFGQHYASSERFVDEIGLSIIESEAAKYYANIVLPYGQQVVKVLNTLSSLEISMICPSHGLCWRQKDHITRIIQLYQQWAQHITDNRVTIVYDTMWKSTELIAQRMYELIENANIPVKMFNLQQTDISDILTDILRSRFLFIGSPILNNRVLPTVASFLMYIKGLKPLKRYAWTFGSYGWATVGFKELETSVLDAGLELLMEGKYIKYIPDEADLKGLDIIVPLLNDKFATATVGGQK